MVMLRDHSWQAGVGELYTGCWELNLGWLQSKRIPHWTVAQATGLIVLDSSSLWDSFET